MDMVGFSSRLDNDRFQLAVKQSPTLEKLLQTQWVQSEGHVSIVSPSHLLREAILHLIKIENQFKRTRWSPTDRRSSLRRWVLWDYGIGRDVLFGAIRDWRVQHPESYFMVMELPEDPELIWDCIAAGAHAYVLQGTSGEQIIEMMRYVERGVFQCPMEIMDRLVEQLVQQQRMSLPRPSSLTSREWDVLYGIGKNQGDLEIATELSISLRTVKHHVHNLLGKLNVQSRWQAMQLARDNSWFEEDRSWIDRGDRSKIDR